MKASATFSAALCGSCCGFELDRGFVFRRIAEQRIDAAIDLVARELLALLLCDAALAFEPIEHRARVFRALGRVLVEQRQHQLVQLARNPTARRHAAGRRGLWHQVTESGLERRLVAVHRLARHDLVQDRHRTNVRRSTDIGHENPRICSGETALWRAHGAEQLGSAVCWWRARARSRSEPASTSTTFCEPSARACQETSFRGVRRRGRTLLLVQRRQRFENGFEERPRRR